MIKLSVCVENVLDGLPFLERIDRVAAAGYAAFEFWHWTGKDLAGILEKKAEHGLDIPIFNCGSERSDIFTDWSQGCLTNPRHRAAFLGGLEQSIEVAHRMGCPALLVLTGDAQSHLSAETQRASVVAGLCEAAELAEQGGVTLALEPLNVVVDHPGYFLTRSADAFAILREVDHPRVKLLFDVYHQQVSEGNVTQNLVAHIASVAHIHVADVPGRHQPGTGELNYPNIFRAVEQAGYTGYVGLEYLPLGDACESLAAVRAMLPPA